MDLFDVYVLRFDVNEERATRGLMQVFGMSEGAARIFVHSVPRVGKRDVPTETAERYVRALHAIGAVVECRRSGSAPLGESANRVQPMSLPAPASSQYPGASSPPHIMQDSLGIMAPLAYSPDMPKIPKAPRVPADLHAIRQRKGPDSLAPNWRAAEASPTPGSGGNGLKNALATSPQPAATGTDQAFWTPDPASVQISSDPIAQLESPFRGQEPAPAKSASEAQLEAVMLDRPSPSPTPLSPSPFAPSGPANDGTPAPWYSTATHQLILAALIVGGMVLALSTGVFETDANRLARAFQRAGVDTGSYELAERYLSRPNSQFEGLSPEALRGLLDDLAKAGAKNVWVGQITQRAATRSSHTLLIELPRTPAARQTLFEELHSITKSNNPLPQDTGQRFLRLDL